jgi:hypothetical protein
MPEKIYDYDGGGKIVPIEDVPVLELEDLAIFFSEQFGISKAKGLVVMRTFGDILVQAIKKGAAIRLHRYVTIEPSMVTEEVVRVEPYINMIIPEHKIYNLKLSKQLTEEIGGVHAKPFYCRYGTGTPMTLAEARKRVKRIRKRG